VDKEQGINFCIKIGDMSYQQYQRYIDKMNKNLQLANDNKLRKDNPSSITVHISDYIMHAVGEHDIFRQKLRKYLNPYNSRFVSFLNEQEAIFVSGGRNK
jgi:hypothetical protein